MFNKHAAKAAGLILTLAFSGIFTSGQVPAVDQSIADGAIDSVVTILLAADGETQPVGSGLIVRSDGYIMTLFSLVKGAREIQIRLRNGETYDKAEVISSDERRNIAILHVNASNLRVIPNGTVEETQVGSRMFALTNAWGQSSIKSDLTLNSVQMADGLPGAGKGYRILQFSSIPGVNATGGLLLDERGRSLGIITTTPDVKGQNIAVPLSSVIGLIRSMQTANPPSSGSTAASYPAPSQTPYPILQSSVLVPQRGVTPLSPKGPGSVVVKPSTIPEILGASKTIYVTSGTISFKPDQLINELNKRPEMAEWGLTFVDERDLADLILEIDHVLYTWKYTFKLYSQRLGTVVATGSRVIWDGNLGAPYMAERFIEKVKVARGIGNKTPNTEVKDKTPKVEDKNEVKKETKVETKKDSSLVQVVNLKTEAEIRKLLRDSRSDDLKGSDKAKTELSNLDAKYVPLLIKISKTGKPCERVEAAAILVTDLDKTNKEVVPTLVDLATGGNLLSLFNLKEEFMCRREAAFLLPFFSEGIHELVKMLKKGDVWEKQSALFAFDDYTEEGDYSGGRLDAMKEAIPAIAEAGKSKDEVLQGMSDEVLGQVVRHSPKELSEVATKYYKDDK